MLEVCYRWRWAAAPILVALGCGKVARDDLGSTVPSSAGMSGATEVGSGGSSGTASGGEAGCGGLIDDLESGSGRICTGSGRIGVWYAFNDGLGEQWPAPTLPGVPISTSEIPGGRGGSTRAMHTYGQGFAGWGVGVGLDFAFDGTSYGSYDASAFDGIRFWARSDTVQKLRVRVSTRPTTIVDYGGTCPAKWCGPHSRDFDVGASWVELSLPFNDLPQADFLRDELTNLQFMPLVEPFDFWIDDVRFYRDRNCCAHPAAGCEGVIAFPDAALEERVRRSVGKRQGDLRCDDVCDVSPLVASGLAEPAKIEDLSGLQCLTGLTQLDLHSNQFADVRPLSSLTQLVSLNLADNLIRDAAALSGLHALESLNLQGNRLQSLTGLGDLPQLNWLSVEDNRLVDVAPAAGFTMLMVFRASRNQLADVRALAALPSLSLLLVESNPIQDLRQFLEFPSLQYVDLAGSAQSCTPEEASVVQALLARGVGVAYGSVSGGCILP